MKVRDIYTAVAVALYNKNVTSNAIPYFGKLLFPWKKKAGLDLKWIKTSKGLPVSLKPSKFDTKSTLRSRGGVDLAKTQMAFFRESFLVSEEDEQEMMRVQESSDPYAQAVLQSIYNDAENLVEGAEVVPERMVMQLLSTATGNPSITIEANGVTYEYNYDPNNTYKTNNFVQLLSTDMWSHYGTGESDPLADVRDAIAAVKTVSGEAPAILLMSALTMTWLIKNASLRSYILAQNVSANIMMNEVRVKQLFREELQIEIVVYAKQFKDESGAAMAFYPDNVVTLIPAGDLGNTWFGTAPEERLIGDPTSTADVTLIDGKIAVTITTTTDPVNTKTTVSEIVLPSYEKMDATYIIKIHTELDGVIAGVVADATTDGATKVTMTPSAAGTGFVYKYKENYSTLPNYGDDLSTWTTYTSAADIATTNGNKIVIAKVDSTSYLAVDAIVVTAVVA